MKNLVAVSLINTVNTGIIKNKHIIPRVEINEQIAGNKAKQLHPARGVSRNQTVDWQFERLRSCTPQKEYHIDVYWKDVVEKYFNRLGVQVYAGLSKKSVLQDIQG